MITGAIKPQIDQIWNASWSGGIANPLEVIEQITYLLFLRRLDDLQTLEENKAARLKEPIARIFPAGKDPKNRPYQDLRWSRFKNMAPSEMYAVVSEHVFPFLRTLGGDDSTYAHHVKDARFPIPPRPLQDEFEQRILQMKSLANRALASGAELDSLFASLQHRAFRGAL